MMSPRQKLPHLLAILGLAAALALFGFRVSEACRSAGVTVGVELEMVAGGVRVYRTLDDGPAQRAGLLAGDYLHEVNGQHVKSFQDYDRIARAFQPSVQIRYRVERNGRQLDLIVHPGMPVNWVALAVATPAMLAYLLLALLVLSLRAKDSRARLLALLSLAVAVQLGLPIESVGRPVLSLVTEILARLMTALQVGVELHLASVIPQPRPWLRRRPWIAALFYVGGLAIVLPALVSPLAVQVGFEGLPWGYEEANNFLFDIASPLWSLAVLALLFHASLRHPDSLGRQQAGLVFLGTVPWACVVLLSAALESSGHLLPTWMGEAEDLTLLCYPLVAFVAIYRYRLFDIELAVRRSFLYTGLSFTLVTLFYTAVGFGGALVARRAPGAGSVWAVGVATLLMGLLFAPLRQGLQKLIDRNFFRERAALRNDLIELADRLPSLGSLPAMGDELVNKLCDALEIPSATLMLANPGAGLLATLASRQPPDDKSSLPPLLAADDPAVQLLERTRRPLTPRQLQIQGSSLEARLQTLRVALVVPMSSRGEIVALMLLGQRSDGSAYSAEEVELLSLLSHHVAIVFENARLFESATRDGLTGLLRREAALQHLDREMRRAYRFQRHLTIGIADLDNFKQVNDIHGHLAGDLVLRRVGRVLGRGLRATDVVGRYGGEEFIIVLPETDMTGAIQGADKLRGMIEGLQTRLENGAVLSITISIGLASFDELPSEAGLPSAESFIAAADERLYLAKRAGRNRVEPSRWKGRSRGAALADPGTFYRSGS